MAKHTGMDEGIGIILGAGFGLIFALLLGINIGVGLSIGAGIGLVVALIAKSYRNANEGGN